MPSIHRWALRWEISTMCAAAIGNIVSDVAGIMLGTVIEDFCTTVLKLPVPKLTDSQRLLRSVRWSGQLGCAVGIVVGCIIGMFPLLFLDPQKTERKKRDAHLEGLFRDVVTEAKTLVGAESPCLFVLRVEPPLTEKEEMLQKKSSESSCDGIETFPLFKAMGSDSKYMHHHKRAMVGIGQRTQCNIIR